MSWVLSVDGSKGMPIAIVAGMDVVHLFINRTVLAMAMMGKSFVSISGAANCGAAFIKQETLA